MCGRSVNTALYDILQRQKVSNNRANIGPELLAACSDCACVNNACLLAFIIMESFLFYCVAKEVEAVCILVKLQNCLLVCQLFPH